MRADEIELLAPAIAGQGTVVRAIAVDLAARELLDPHTIGDIRLAFGGACEALIDLAMPDSTLRCLFRAADGCVQVTMQVRSTLGGSGVEPLRDGVEWESMAALADYLRLSIGPDGDDGDVSVITVQLARSRQE